MILTENIRYLCKKNNIHILSLEKELNLSKGYFSRIKTLSIKAKTLYEIAKKFNVSMEDLIEKPLYKDERITQLKAELKELEAVYE